jgi:GT2 family glycosyltransferase
MTDLIEKIGVVAIGRNEGERLTRCLDALLKTGIQHQHIVYVDSGSTDNSCQQAQMRQLGVVELDLSVPFTAGRARNTGFEHLIKHHPQLKYIQFIDGDCQLHPDWLTAAAAALEISPEVAGVCGWRRELYPEKTIYNQICDIEWRSGPVGEIACFGGDALVRAQAVADATGFNPEVIAGEEPELCMRLRQAGWKILRLDQEMTLHDAQMEHFYQWWQRAKRAGHAYAQVSAIHGKPPENGYVKEFRRLWLWGGILPVLSLLACIPTKGFSLLLLGRYPVAAWRASAPVHRQGWGWRASLIWGLSCAISPFPQVLGATQYLINRLQRRQSTIIEYKGSHPQST